MQAHYGISPDPQISGLLHHEPISGLFPETGPDLDLKTGELGFAHKNPTIVVRPSEAGPAFTQIVDVQKHPPREWFAPKGGALARADPWLIGGIEYEAVTGQIHRTRFCFRGRSDGAAEEKGGPPYNERT